MKLIIEQIENRWTINGKFFTEMSDQEKEVLTKFIKTYDSTNQPKQSY